MKHSSVYNTHFNAFTIRDYVRRNVDLDCISPPHVSVWHHVGRIFNTANHLMCGSLLETLYFGLSEEFQSFLGFFCWHWRLPMRQHRRACIVREGAGVVSATRIRDHLRMVSADKRSSFSRTQTSGQTTMGSVFVCYFFGSPIAGNIELQQSCLCSVACSKSRAGFSLGRTGRGFFCFCFVFLKFKDFFISVSISSVLSVTSCA